MKRRAPNQPLPLQDPSGRSDSGKALMDKFSAVLTTGPVPGPMKAAEDRPVSRRTYFPLNVWKSGTTEPTDAIFIPLTPSRLSGPGGSPGPKGMLRNFLTLGV